MSSSPISIHSPDAKCVTKPFVCNITTAPQIIITNFTTIIIFCKNKKKKPLINKIQIQKKIHEKQNNNEPFDESSPSETPEFP